MTLSLRGGGEGEDICCGLYVEIPYLAEENVC